MIGSLWKTVRQVRRETKPRYRWTVVGYTAGWFHVEDLARRQPGSLVRFLPPLRPRSLSNGGW